MLRELIEYYLTPTTKEAKKSGYLYEAMAFQARGRRNKKHWQPHWQTCQDLVEDFLGRHPRAKSIAILGSGCLFEIPKEALARKLEKIVLIDQVFPLSVRAWAKKEKNKVEMRAIDLAKSFPENLNCDLIISANLLSQLTLTFESQIDKIAIEQKHLADLTREEKPALLWTDVERTYSDAKTGDKMEQEKTVFSPLPLITKEWVWNIAPAPEFDSKINVTLKIKSFVC